MPRLTKLLRVPTPADRGPGQPWRPGTPVPLALAPDTPSAPPNSPHSPTTSPRTAWS
ncbi:hypothetical protein [Streptomyces sp. NPDC005898]|uniref:hypothetical protein n=1 Tax=Streptomyces sp. NPDC005898 TaxID=3157082 RepID=UPI0033F0A21B